MRCILLLSLPFAVSSGLKPVPYGSLTPVQTLFPLLVPSDLEQWALDVEEERACDVDPSIESSTRGVLNLADAPLAQNASPVFEILRRQDQGRESDYSSGEDSTTDSEPEPDDPNDEDFAEPGSKKQPKASSSKNHGKNSAGKAPTSDPNVNPNGVTKGRYAGELQIDCLEAPEQCQNVCWYQNCVRDPKVRVEYMAGNDGVGDFNRVHSGVTTQNGRPCTTGPFGQKFWDTYPFNRNTNAMYPDGWQARKREAYLETDEWPMASFDNPEFDSKADPIQRSLRCITGESNGSGGTMIENFMAGGGPYNTKQSAPGYQKYHGRWAHHRKFDGDLAPGDWFYTNANFESFDDGNTTHQKILETLYYCKAPYAECKNDGRQFHLTQLRHKGLGSDGRLDAEYDITRHNTYRIDKEDDDIHQYHIVLDITGVDANTVGARVFEWQTIQGTRRSEKRLASRASGTLNDGDEFILKEDLPRSLKVEKSGTGCGTFTFTYADPKTDGHRVFRFRSDDKGYAKWARAEAKAGQSREGHYCLPEDLWELDSKGNKKKDKDGKDIRAGTSLHCSFPGW